jgi:hypothetical protein
MNANLYPLHAPQRVSEIWLPVFTVSQGARRKGRRSMANGEMVGGGAVLRRAWNRPQRGGGRARGGKKSFFFFYVRFFTDARTDDWLRELFRVQRPRQYALAFFRVPRILLVYILAPTVSAGRASCLRPGYLALAVEQRHASVPVWPPAPTAAAVAGLFLSGTRTACAYVSSTATNHSSSANVSVG